LAKLLCEVKSALPVPIAGVVSDGQTSIRNAVALALEGVPHQLCHFHYLREAALPVYEADRHAKVQLKKKVRGIRPIERKVEARQDSEAEAIRGYCAAVRSALTDDGPPQLDSVRRGPVRGRGARGSRVWSGGAAARAPAERPPAAGRLGAEAAGPADGGR